MYGNTSIWGDIKREFTGGNVVSQLIIVNVVIFVVINLVTVGMFLASGSTENPILPWIMLHANVMDLLRRPWTLITHMFAHYGIWHLLFNMLWLFWFGKIIQEFIGNKKILPLYIYGGIMGAALLIISYNIFPGLKSDMPYVSALGASAGVLAIVVAAATLVPDYTVFLLFFGGVKIKYIALFMVILDMVSIPGLNSGGRIAHLGGALFGYVFIKQLQMGHDWSMPFNDFMEAIASLFKKREPRIVYKTKAGNQKRKRTDYPEDKQQKVDALLDKIASSGYDSLTKEEKEFLFKASKDA